VNLYPTLLQAHSVLRWVVLLLLAVRAARALQAWSASVPFSRNDRVLSLATVIVVDTQFLLGLALYLWFSPLAAAARSRAGEAMADPILRFWLVEHPVAMILSVVAVHVGNRRTRSAASDRSRHGAAAVSAFVALALVCAGIPWGFRGL
jgi:hypothetical protein